MFGWDHFEEDRKGRVKKMRENGWVGYLVGKGGEEKSGEA